MVVFHKVDGFLEERLNAVYQKQLLPAILVIVAFVLTLGLEQIRYSDYYPLHLLITFVLLLRALGTIFYRKKEGTISTLWLSRIENMTTLFSAVLGIAYTEFVIHMEQIFGSSYAGVFYFLFFILVLGALNSMISSFKISLGLVLGSYGTLFLIWAFKSNSSFDYLFTYMMIPFSMIYLIKAQYDGAVDFVLKTKYLKEKEQHILELQKRISLEEELKKQKEANIHSARLASLGEMASGISHEINNPLAIISMNVQAMKIHDKHGELTLEESRKGIENIQIAIDRATKIMNSLRIFARDERMGNIKEVTIHTIIALTTNLTESRFKVNNIDFKVDLHCDENILVMVNEVAMSQVLVNLLNNAYYVLEKHGQVPLWCRLDVWEKEENIHFCVVDSGPGIPHEAISRVFDPFFTTKPPGEGTGVGLSMSKSMMQNMKGDLYIDTHAAHTTFVASIPKKGPE